MIETAPLLAAAAGALAAGLCFSLAGAAARREGAVRRTVAGPWWRH